MTGSTLPRRTFGRRLRELRGAAGKSQLAAGLHIEVSKQTIGRLEDGRVARISTAQFRDLLDFYRADAMERSEVLGLLQEVKATKDTPATGWWRACSDVGHPHFKHFMSLEQACSRMTSYQMTLVPGLLQTSDYRRWIEVAGGPTVPEVEIERRLELLALRQRRLTDSPSFQLHVLLSEAVLRYRIGGVEVMAQQMRRIIEVSRLPNVSVRVIPFAAAPHPGLFTQSFTLLEFPALTTRPESESPVVYVESYTGSLFVEEPELISRHRGAAEDIQQKALDEEGTRELVQQIAKEYES